MELVHGSCTRQVLRPGEVLLLPQGVLHSARAITNEVSVHVTVGVKGARRRLQEQTCDAMEGPESQELCESGLGSCPNRQQSECPAGTWSSSGLIRAVSCDEFCDEGPFAGGPCDHDETFGKCRLEDTCEGVDFDWSCSGASCDGACTGCCSGSCDRSCDSTCNSGCDDWFWTSGCDDNCVR